jgi:FkbM family methyltransferase
VVPTSEWAWAGRNIALMTDAFDPAFVRSLGMTTRPEFRAGIVPAVIRPSDVDEWATLLAAIQAAGEHFTMIELGAGFGRWTVNAATALRRIKPHTRHRFAAVEAEPTHFAWLRLHTRDNGLRRWSRRGTCRLIHAAVSGRDGEDDEFYVGNPAGWYGQALVRPENSGAAAPTMRVRTIRLGNLLRDLGSVDLVDMDIQGTELEVLVEARPELHRVRRIYVETHSEAIDDALPDLLADWTLVAAQRVGERVETAFGLADYGGGGFQSWVNPEFSQAPSASTEPGRGRTLGARLSG